jgi:hypothetical protein
MNRLENVFITLKPADMKHFISIPIILIFFLTVSCKKDSIKSGLPSCDTCDQKSTLILGTLFITDSNWVKQPDGTFKSDITGLILQAGGTVKQLYTMEILNDNILYQIYPNYQVKLLGGTFYGSVVNRYDNEICTVTYRISDQNKYFGELPNGGLLPFQFIVIRVLIAK